MLNEKINDNLSVYDIAKALREEQQKFVKDSGGQRKLDFSISKNESISEIIQKMRQSTVKLFSTLRGISKTGEGDFWTKSNQILDDSHAIIDELEPVALSDREGTDKTIVKIARIADDNYKPHRDGDPNLIVVANADKGSAQQQFDLITEQITSNIADFVESGAIKCLVSYGSTLIEPKKPGDLDYLLVVDKEKLVSLHRDKSFDRSQTKLIDEIVSQIGWGDFVHFKLVGDTITTEHSMTIKIVDVKRFTERLNPKDGDRQKFLNEEKSMFSNYDGKKLNSYSGTKTTFEERIVASGALIEFGTNILDKNGNRVFKEK